MCDCASVYCAKLLKLCGRAVQFLEMAPIAFSETVFVFAQFKGWPAFCPLSRSHLGFHVVLSHYETILWMFIVFWLYSHRVLSWNDGSNFRQCLVVDICFYMGWPRGFASRIHRRLKFLQPCTFIAVETQSQPVDCVLSLCWDCTSQIISLFSKVHRVCDISSKFKHFFEHNELWVYLCYLYIACLCSASTNKWHTRKVPVLTGVLFDGIWDMNACDDKTKCFWPPFTSLPSV